MIFQIPLRDLDLFKIEESIIAMMINLMAAESAPPEPAGLATAPTLCDSGARRGGEAGTATVPQPEPHDSDPVRIGRYVVLRRLGKGGMGLVYLAYDGDLDRKVAVKVVRGSVQREPLVRERVIREAQSLAQVAHPNIVHVYEVGHREGEIFIAMEYVPGVVLSQWQSPPDQGPRPSVEAILRVYLQAATGLYAAHCRGLIHRDFKPDNVLLGEDGRARVLDFGLARAQGRDLPPAPTAGGAGRMSSEERLTQVGAIMGTPGYMSPEQIRGIDADARSDQFSFCAALYEALYQRLPFAGETFDTYSQEVLAGRVVPPPPSEVPIVVEQALLRGLSTAPERRFPSMAELIQALQSGLHPNSESPTTRRANRRFRLLLLVMTILTTLGGLRNGLDRGVGSMAHAALMLGGMLLGMAAVLLLLRRTLLRRAIYRRVAYAYMVIVTYLVLSRVFGYVQGMELGRYTSMEMLAAAALLFLEAPHASPQYRWLGALTLGGATVTLILPQLSVLILSVTYPVLAVAGVYYRMQDSPQPMEPAVTPAPGIAHPEART